MQSDSVEYIRFDDLETGILIPGKPYLLTHGKQNSFKEVRTPMSQMELLNELGKHLRYGAESGVSAEEQEKQKWEAIKKFSDRIHDFFVPFHTIDKNTQHLEVFLSPSELALIPFELMLDENEEPRFIKKNENHCTLTRNSRRDSAWKDRDFPLSPRVLFVHTRPTHKNYLNLPFPDVPFKKHVNAIDYAMKHMDKTQQLTVLANPSFKKFSRTLLEATEEERPYTHVHILAHGSLLFDFENPSNFEFGIAFYSEEPLDQPYKATSAEEISALFDQLKGEHLPYLVNYMICDGANFTNGIKPDRNPVQATFSAGVPIVIGSQFPLSMHGSNLITKELYKRLFKGDDLREILGDIRTNLYIEKEEFGHDWISLVSYCEFPVDYEFRVLEQKTSLQLSILNKIRDDSEEELNGSNDLDDFIEVQVEIENTIEALSAQVTALQNRASGETGYLEANGLLGSAYKRLAEVEWKARKLGADTSDKQRAYLQAAMKWYKKAADRNQSHHWSLIQYLSLKTILDGPFAELDMDYWYATRSAALFAIEEDKNSIWPYGTLIELYLLSPNAAKTEKIILSYAESLVKNARKKKTQEPIKSTYLQVARYKEWWLQEGFVVPKTFQVSDAGFLKKVLQILHYSDD